MLSELLWKTEKYIIFPQEGRAKYAPSVEQMCRCRTPHVFLAHVTLRRHGNSQSQGDCA